MIPWAATWPDYLNIAVSRLEFEILVTRKFTAWAPYYAAFGFALLVFATGGGARADIESLIILRPITALLFVASLAGLSARQFQSLKIPLCFMAALILLVIIQLIPLPPAIWASLPGRAPYAEVARIVGIDQPWRPISFVPDLTWNSLFALLVPATMLLLYARMDKEQQFLLLPLLIGIGFASGLLGLMQAIGPADGPLYFYRITNNGSAVGLFANRNHQAALLACMFPMLAVFASTDMSPITRTQLRIAVCLGIGIFVIPLILVTGSRAGLALGLIGLASTPLLYRGPGRKPARRLRGVRPRLLLGGILVLALIVITIVMSRATAVERLFASGELDDLRLKLIEPVTGMIQTYFPVGIGFGAFPIIYKVHEPFTMLMPTYVNHVHDDVLEFVLEGGVAALILLLAGLALWVVRAIQLARRSDGSRRSVRFARLGAVVSLILGLASIVDYPLRVPSMAVLFAIAIGWMAFPLGIASKQKPVDDRSGFDA